MVKDFDNGLAALTRRCKSCSQVCAEWTASWRLDSAAANVVADVIDAVS